MKATEPILLVELFPEERASLLEVLAHSSLEELDKPTVCPGWSVRDIALHLLGDDLSLLSRERDGFKYPLAPGLGNVALDWNTLVTLLNQWNELWVAALRRVSPQLLVSLLEFSGQEFYKYVSAVDPFEQGWEVGWAGKEDSPRWLHIAREYTERWIHQQQIRDALGKPGAKETRLFHPVLAAFVWALPRTFEKVEAENGTLVQLIITGEAGGSWFVQKGDSRWSLGQEAETTPDASVTLDQEVAWRLFTKGISKEEALKTAVLQGQQALAEKVLDTVSIIA